jgi:uncharacterized protein with NRDE domain
MCIIYFALDRHPEFPLVLAANRDEFYERPTQSAHWWSDHPDILAGRDLVAGGTWLGITKRGRVAAVTNYREPGAPKGTRSRGDLVADFLKSSEPAESYLSRIEEWAEEYSGFNLLVGEFSSERRAMFYFSNRDNVVRELGPGVYALSNHLLDTPWPKVKRGKARFAELVSSRVDREAIFDLLADEAVADDHELPSTGLEYKIEKALSAIFIKTPIYGTRCSTVVTFDERMNGELEERVFM